MSIARNLQHVGKRIAVSLKAVIFVAVIGLFASVVVSFAAPRIVVPDAAGTMAESFLVADRLPSLSGPMIEPPDTTCAGSMDASGDECGNGLERTFAPATWPSLDKRAGPALSKVGAATVLPPKTAKSAAEQPNAENHIVGCAGGMDAAGSDCN